MHRVSISFSMSRWSSINGIWKSVKIISNKKGCWNAHFYHSTGTPRHFSHITNASLERVFQLKSVLQ